ncbi:hypothetical protein OG21DRAFT_1487788 [Imleria badia]|nr:hypothetical protein OG21DRAFT_1487788 [Imleria badia]
MSPSNNSSRVHLAHEHHHDLDSSPSSPSSGTPTFFDSHGRSKLASHQRSPTATDGSRSSHLIARLVSLGEEVREISAATVITTKHLEAETSRANAAERRALRHLRIATENRERAEQESARLREALELCKLQLENAQKDIFRAQDIIDQGASQRNDHRPAQLAIVDQQRELMRYMSGLHDWLARDVQDRQAELRGVTARVDQLREDLGRLGVGAGPGVPIPQPQPASQRNEAEAEAARARTKTKKLQEEKLMMLAREEGRRMGYQEGLSRGRRIGYDEGYHDGDEYMPELGAATSDEERNDSRSHVQSCSAASTRQQPMRCEAPPPVHLFETSLHAPPLPARVYTPSHGHRSPSPPRDLDKPETIHPIPIRSPIISSQPISVPIDDGWIPRADSRTSYIRLPPPHELRQPTPPSPSSVATEVQDSRATQQSPPTPVSPPVRSRDYAYQTSVPPLSLRRHTPSIASRTSTHISQHDMVNRRPGGSLQNEIYVGRARSESQPSRERTSRNEHRDQDRRHSSRTEVESIAEQWEADDDASMPRNSPRSFTPSEVPHLRHPPGFIVTSPPLGDVDPQLRRRVPTESAAVRSHPLPDHPASRPARSRSVIVTPTPLGEVDNPEPRRRIPTESESASQLDILQVVSLPSRFPRRDLRSLSIIAESPVSSIPDINIEPPSEPETTMSPFATTMGFLSPDHANQPLPQDAPIAPPHPPILFIRRHHVLLRTRSQTGPSSRSFPPHARSRSQSQRAPQKRPRPDAHAEHIDVNGPRVRPHPSHRRHRDREWDRDRDRDRDRDGEREREKTRDTTRDVDWDRDRERVQDRDRDRRRDSGRDYELERDRDRDRDGEDPEDTGLDEEVSRSPLPLQRPVSLFDSDEER